MIEVYVGIFVIIFAILSIFIIRALITLQKTLSRLDNALSGVEIKLQRLDSFSRAISNVGDVCENESERLKKRHLLKCELEEEFGRKAKLSGNLSNHLSDGLDDSDISTDVVDWIGLSLKLGQKFLNRR